MYLRLMLKKTIEATIFLLKLNLKFQDETTHRATVFKELVKVTAADYAFDLNGLSIIALLGAGVYFGFKYVSKTYLSDATVSAATCFFFENPNHFSLFCSRIFIDCKETKSVCCCTSSRRVQEGRAF
jgi:hypothetical protein